MSNDNKTRKKYSKTHKIDLWKQFDENVESDKIKCVYDNTTNTTTCDVCTFPLLVNEIQVLTCSNTKCGIMYMEKLTLNTDCRVNSFSNPDRCGMPVNPLLQESSYGCKIICHNNSYEMKKIKRYTEWQAMPYKEKALYDEFQRILILGQNHGIPKSIIDDAFRYHKKMSERKTFRGVNRDGIIAASIYIACRINDNPRSAKEIAYIFNLDNTSSTKGCKNATLIINELEYNYKSNEKTYLHESRPESFINRYCSKLNINDELSKLCLFIAIKVFKNNIIPENTPPSIAAGIIYFVSNNFKLNIRKDDVYNVSDISEVTINKCFKKLTEHKSVLIPSSLLNKYNS